MPRHSFAASLVGFSLTMAASSAAHAQGFVVNRFDPSERGSDWFANESLDLRGGMRLAAGVVADYGVKPLVAYNADGSERVAIISHQFFLHPGASLAVGGRVRLGLSLPLLLSQDGNSTSVGGKSISAANGANVGDLRVGGDLRLLGEYGEPATLALGVRYHVPTGAPSSFISDGAGRFAPQLEFAGDASILAYAARAGFLFHGTPGTLAGRTFGTEFTFGAAAGVRFFDRRLLVGPEISGSSVVANADLFAPRTSPVEALVGAHYASKLGLRFNVGAGPGLTRGYGEPGVRVVASLEWFPPPSAESDVVPPSEELPVAPVREAPKHVPEPAPPPPKEAPTAVEPPPVAAHLDSDQIKLNEPVKFKSNSAELLSESDGVLAAVVKVLQDHPEIKKVSVEGHTDARGLKGRNVALSKRRADAVVKWIVSHGISKDRLTSKGFGPDKPIDDNGTELGRHNNRRVEFRVVNDASKKPAKP